MLDIRLLSEIEQAWLNLFAELKRSNGKPAVRSSDLSAPFLSDALPGYEPGGPGTIMLVGEATAGKNTLGNVDVKDEYDAVTVKQRTPAVIGEVLEGKYASDFWRFARRLGDAAAKQSGLHPGPFANVIWTNLAKIGTIHGNPSASILNVQDALVVETILAEVVFYRPRLLVFVTGDFGYGRVSRVLRRLVGSREGEGRTKERDWSFRRQANAPAILWTTHPQGKPAEWTASKIARALELLSD